MPFRRRYGRERERYRNRGVCRVGSLRWLFKSKVAQKGKGIFDLILKFSFLFIYLFIITNVTTSFKIKKNVSWLIRLSFFLFFNFK